jgi:hypothetical protein
MIKTRSTGTALSSKTQKTSNRALINNSIYVTKHDQWNYRNQTVHYKAKDGLTETQQLDIMQHCEDLLWTDPSVLLPEDRGLLDVDFEALGDGPAIARQMWLEEMKSATSASRIAGGAQSAGNDGGRYLEVPVDTEGSIRFRRRRRRAAT